MEPNNAFFLFEVTSLERARAFISDLAAAEAGRKDVRRPGQ
jgi:hypothetical protein